MNKEKKNNWFTLKFYTSKIAQVAVAVGGMATITSCTMFLHEKKVPSELLNNHHFSDKE